MIKIILFVLGAEIFMVAGHVLFKKTTSALGAHNFKSAKSRIFFLKAVAAKPAIWTGILLIAIGLVVWLLALAQGDLSLVFSIGSLQFVLTLFAAHIFLDEKIDRMKLCGTLLVVLGIVLTVLN